MGPASPAVVAVGAADALHHGDTVTGAATCGAVVRWTPEGGSTRVSMRQRVCYRTAAVVEAAALTHAALEQAFSIRCRQPALSAKVPAYIVRLKLAGWLRSLDV